MLFFLLRLTAAMGIPRPTRGCGRSSGVEHNLAKVRVGRSNRLARSKINRHPRLKTKPPFGRLLFFRQSSRLPVRHKKAARIFYSRQARDKKKGLCPRPCGTPPGYFCLEEAKSPDRFWPGLSLCIGAYDWLSCPKAPGRPAGPPRRHQWPTLGWHPAARRRGPETGPLPQRQRSR